MEQKNEQKTNLMQKASTIFLFALLIAVVALIYYFYYKKPIDYESKHLITAEQAKVLWNNYNNPLKDVSVPDSLNSNATWFSIEELENFIAYAKAEADNKKVQLSGMRLYFGRYPEGLTQKYFDGEKERVKNIGGLNTIFISPTGKFRTEKGQALTAPTQDSVSQDPDIAGLKALNFGSSGMPPHATYNPQ